jgi:hypothetical protein
VKRSHLGIPLNWSETREWLEYNGPIFLIPEPILTSGELKFPEIPSLERYDGVADEQFWKIFPKSPLPEAAETQINVENLERQVAKVKKFLTSAQLKRAGKAIEYLRNGAPSHQATELDACHVANSSKTVVNGRVVTDNIATWIKMKYAAGPFSEPPIKKFRVNPLLAVVQPTKVRPVLNVSMPKELSFNSNIQKEELEKVKMSSAGEFANALIKSGHGAIMSKFDLVAAYKQVPCKIEDLRLQGFMWLGKFFCETRQIFGAGTSVCNYDILGETLKTITLAQCDIPHNLVMRQVDDVPVVSPKNSGWCEEFSAKYKEICKELNVELAENCPKADKAFENVKKGKVLGVLFDSENLTWALPQEKRVKTLRSVAEVFHGEVIKLKPMQKLMGRLNHVTQMCDFLKNFTAPLNESFAGVPSDSHPETIVLVSGQAKDDLRKWAGFLAKERWLPIQLPESPPPRTERK